MPLTLAAGVIAQRLGEVHALLLGVEQRKSVRLSRWSGHAG